MGGRQPGPLGLNNNPVIDPGTMCLDESYPPGPTGIQPMPAHRDEITPIAHYIAFEINTNARSHYTKKIAELNRFSVEECITDYQELSLLKQLFGFGVTPAQCIDLKLSYHSAALLLWTMKVRAGGDWDH